MFIRVQNTDYLRYAFDVDPLYLKHENQGIMPDFRVGCKSSLSSPSPPLLPSHLQHQHHYNPLPTTTPMHHARFQGKLLILPMLITITTTTAISLPPPLLPSHIHHHRHYNHHPTTTITTTTQPPPSQLPPNHHHHYYHPTTTITIITQPPPSLPPPHHHHHNYHPTITITTTTQPPPSSLLPLHLYYYHHHHYPLPGTVVRQCRMSEV